MSRKRKRVTAEDVASPVVKWRYVCPTRTGAWWPSRKEAEAEAVEHKAGHRTEYGAFYADVFTTFESEKEKA